jgi:hypothetical protein
MRDRGLILGGLVLFLLLATFPVWYNVAAGTVAKAPEPKRSREPACVEATALMRTGHMDLLLAWREQAVREGRRTYVASDGRTHAIGLTQTCMRCHESRADFCDRCHDYAGARPTCWGCHVDPKSLGEGRG